VFNHRPNLIACGGLGAAPQQIVDAPYFVMPLTSPVMSADIRRIKPTDWQMLRELRLASLLDAPEAFGQTHDNALAIPDAEWQQIARVSASGNTRTWLIASVDGADAGLVQARKRAPDDCLIFSMWVAPGARRTGIGHVLIDAVADWAAGWGARRLVLWVFGANDGAHRFYEAIGFKVIPDGPDAESGKSFGAFALERPIPLDAS
jgi:GNAT superfamily N-acetyltransferase